MTGNIAEKHKEILEQAKGLANALSSANQRNDADAAQNLAEQQKELFASYSAEAHAQLFGLKRMEFDSLAKDGKITKQEVLEFRLSEHEGENFSFKEVKQQVDEEFAGIKGNFKDLNPDDDVIDLNEVAAKEIEFLQQAFPEQMKNANKDAAQNTGALAQLLDIAKTANHGRAH